MRKKGCDFLMVKKDTKKYYLLLKKRIQLYCDNLKEKLKRFPRSIIKKIGHIDIPPEEIVMIKENSYPLKIKVKELSQNYKLLYQKTKTGEYKKYLDMYRSELREKKDIDPKTAYNTVEMEMMKEFELQKEKLYEALIIMNTLVRYLKRKNKEEASEQK